MSNTSRWIPYDAVGLIAIRNERFPDYPHLSGTGFLVVFPPYQHLFLVTARHCVFCDRTNELSGAVEIYISGERIPVSEHLTGQTTESAEFFQDIAVFVIGKSPHDIIDRLGEKAIELKHQDDVDSILGFTYENRENLRIVGFPGCSKKFDYDSNLVTAAARGAYGKISQWSKKNEIFEVDGLNWKEGELNGFSGSPVLALLPNSTGGVTPIPVGVVVTGSSNGLRAINMNVATNFIACWIAHKEGIDIGCDIQSG